MVRFWCCRLMNGIQWLSETKLLFVSSYHPRGSFVKALTLADPTNPYLSRPEWPDWTQSQSSSGYVPMF